MYEKDSIKTKVSVIYAIQHNKTKRIYIGTTVDIHSRYREHIKMLANNQHSSRRMQADFAKYGNDFSVYILEEVPYSRVAHPYIGGKTIASRNVIEANYMKEYDTFKNGYNEHDKAAYRLAYGKEKKVLFSAPIKEGKPEMVKWDD